MAVEIDEFREGEDPVYIRAVLAVERESQKPIVLGKGGRTIRAIGTAARERIAAFLGPPRVPRPLGDGVAAVAPRPRRARAPRTSAATGERPMSLPKDLLEILVCPKCKGDLDVFR